MAQVRKKVKRPDGNPGFIYEYWRGVDRCLDINPYVFYQAHYKSMPILERGIRTILGHKAGSDSPERVFSKGGIIVNPKRCSLLPTRADKLITSAVRFTCKSKKVKRTPTIPDIGVIDDGIKGVRNPGTAAARVALIAEIDDCADDFFANNVVQNNLDADDLNGEEIVAREEAEDEV